jgi:hypothetical protein
MNNDTTVRMLLEMRCELLHHKAATKLVIERGQGYHSIFEWVSAFTTTPDTATGNCHYYSMEDLQSIFLGWPDSSLKDEASKLGTVGTAARLEVQRRLSDETMVGSWTDDHVIARLRSFARTGLEKAALEELIKRYDSCVKAYVEVACE